MSKENKLTSKEFACRIGYSDRQIRRWLSSGKLISRRNLGGRPYFLESDVEKFNHFMENNTDNASLDLTEEINNDHQSEQLSRTDLSRGI